MYRVADFCVPALFFRVYHTGFCDTTRTKSESAGKNSAQTQCLRRRNLTSQGVCNVVHRRSRGEFSERPVNRSPNVPALPHAREDVARRIARIGPDGSVIPLETIQTCAPGQPGSKATHKHMVAALHSAGTDSFIEHQRNS